MRDFVSFYALPKRSLKNPVRVKVRVKTQKKALKPLGFQDFLWQRVKDSNPHIQSQSLLCYLYTNPLYLSAAANRYYYTEIRFFVKGISEILFDFFYPFRPPKNPLKNPLFFSRPLQDSRANAF